jgi:hypothetical protein
MNWQIRSNGRGGRRSGGWGALFLGVAAIGCTEEQTGFFIEANVKVDPPECIARAEGSVTRLLGGSLDVGLAQSYGAILLVGSQLAPRGDKTNLRSETMITTITGAEVHLYTDTGEPDPYSPEFTVPATGVILPSGSADPGYGVVPVTLIPAATGVELAREITSTSDYRTRVAVVSVFGTTIGGLDIESAEFTYVITVCEGCLVEFPLEALSTVDGSCGGSVEDSAPTPCAPGQDDYVDCRLCSGVNPFCTFPNGAPPP